ncbi:MAG: hypothetical protein HW390_836 [Candidatus Brocadiaceae bacterium]|nr:hypothetical protein [Candidatus Brocadiaceae bacterium]
MYDFLFQILIGASGNLAADAVKKVLEKASDSKANQGAKGSRKVDSTPVTGLPESGETCLDIGEPPRFLCRQRVLHRINLATTKWHWLLVAYYYHPVRGRPLAIPDGLKPDALAGQFTVADFCGKQLPQEEVFLNQVPSSIRRLLLVNRMRQIGILLESIGCIDKEIKKVETNLSLPLIPFSDSETCIPWITFFLEIRNCSFPGLPQFNSYCGFKNLWSIRDTPAHGIRPYDDTRANLYAYAAILELASILAKKNPLSEVYARAFEADHPNPHQFALRKVAVAVIKELWPSVRDWTKNM